MDAIDLETDNEVLKYLWDKIPHKMELIKLDEKYQKFIDDQDFCTTEDVDKAIDKIVEWFYDDESTYCNKLISKLMDFQGEHQEYIQDKLQSVPEVVELIVDIKNMEKANKIKQEIDNGETDDWTKVKDSDDLKLLYKQEEGQKLYTFYGEKVINAPLFNLSSILREL